MREVHDLLAIGRPLRRAGHPADPRDDVFLCLDIDDVRLAPAAAFDAVQDLDRTRVPARLSETHFDEPPTLARDDGLLAGRAVQHLDLVLIRAVRALLSR